MGLALSVVFTGIATMRFMLRKLPAVGLMIFQIMPPSGNHRANVLSTNGVLNSSEGTSLVIVTYEMQTSGCPGWAAAGPLLASTSRTTSTNTLTNKCMREQLLCPCTDLRL